jgi:hypothetical protein
LISPFARSLVLNSEGHSHMLKMVRFPFIQAPYLTALFAVFLVIASSAPAQQSGGTDSGQSQPDPESTDSAAKPSLLTPLKPQPVNVPYHPITDRQRLRWFLTNTIGPAHLAGGLFTAAMGTAVDRPKEYGPGWAGFGDRFGMRLTGIVTSNAMEAGVGRLWREDPRYFRVPDQPFKARLRNVVRLTFMARRADGRFYPAYARYIAFSGSNFLSNTWRADSEANSHDAVIRIFEGFGGRLASNAFEEFWPDVKSHLSH